jgi:hypothetical protein
MNTKTIAGIVSSAVLGLSVISGLAAEGQTGKSSESSESSKRIVPPAPAGRMILGVTIAEAELVATGWRASKLIGAQVQNDANQKIGKVDDLIVAPDGSLTFAVVEVGGFLGIGAHKVAIPVKQFSEIAPKATLPGATKDALKALPEFKYMH